jgi:hypothetical protein
MSSSTARMGKGDEMGSRGAGESGRLQDYQTK